MTALETMKQSLREVQREQMKCVTEIGYVKPWLRYEYQTLMQKANDISHAIETWERMGWDDKI